MATLAEICQDALTGIDGFGIPTTFVGNEENQTAELTLSLATQVARELTRKYKWQVLKKEHSFTTVNGQEGYDLPEDFQRFANLTFWSESDRWPLIQVSNVGWRELKSGLIVSGIRFYFIVSGGKFRINPTPSSAYQIAFDYYSKNFALSSNGSDEKSEWTDDDDIWRLDPDLLTLGIRYRFRSRKGQPFAEDKADYIDAIRDALFDDTPKPVIDTGVVPRRDLLEANVPDGNWSMN